MDQDFNVKSETKVSRRKSREYISGFRLSEEDPGCPGNSTNNQPVGLHEIKKLL